MTDHNELATGPEDVPESLRTLAAYLERALDSATSIVMMRPTDDVCIVYLGDPAGLREDLKQIATIATSVANSMLESTFSGVNEVQINGQLYRFARSFTQVDDMAAVVFSMD
ncbi:hypothetical protein [Paraburkholderia fynbosensis]|uniref:Uncharacterized protein n=1 Tax=Paraburkholderia fynbosensis TaxID=1200993 RepID=A0A6J5GQZ4_9BURK|nr:hypothetical protein [Paraburkholderia fynbosensis]CAB3805413.1 hypothetical protein LMG27177_05868 [Paraburkholderia fynbosensis]